QNGRVNFYKFYHTEPDEIGKMMRDVVARIRRAKGLTGEAQRRELAVAIRGYFNAMPFERGSDAIGRSFWSGTVQHVTGRKVMLPDGVDYRAMILRERDFVDWLAPRLQ